ncbi:MAG: hypothetical protein PVH61_31585 [Candidatus Aminicenantes bacterium]|jgi:hypothetical protein
MSLPEVKVIRERIESCKQEDIRMYLKAVYLFGARAVELAGKRCSGEKQIVYGPKGSDAWLAETEPPDIPSKQLAEILIMAITDRDGATALVKKLSENISVGIFKIRIAKQKLDEGEEVPYRLIGLPLEFDLWNQEVYDYFKEAGDDYVFPFNRSYVWDYLTHKQPIFKGLTYRIKKYNYNRVGKPIFKVLPHPRKLKIHGLRHVRTDELISKYGFDALDMVAFVGWKLTKSGPQGGAAPAMADVYAEIREAWHRYIKKLCKVTT